jgi:hypothetical protein
MELARARLPWPAVGTGPNAVPFIDCDEGIAMPGP